MYKLTNLQTLELDPRVPLQSFAGWSDLILLRSLHVGIDKLHDGPNLRKLSKLERLSISGWQGRGFSSLAEFVLLESVIVDNCKGLSALPGLERLSRLRILAFRMCEFEDLSSLCNLSSLEELDIKDCDKLEALLDLQELARLEKLRVKGCVRLIDLRGILGLRNLKLLDVRGHSWLHENLGQDLHRLTGLRNLNVSNGGFADLQWLATYSELHFLNCSGCPIQELPDLANFPKLSHLDVQDCVNLTNMTCMGPCSPEFDHLSVSGCKRLQSLPDFTNSRKMQCLDVANTRVELSAEYIQDMKARWPSIHLVTDETSSWVRRQLISLDI